MENKFDNQENSNINIREELEKYLVHWRWFVLSVFITVALAFVYLRYSQKIYSISTSIIVKDEKRGGGIASEMAAFADLGMFSGGKSNVENETQVLQSRSLAERTVRRLQLNIALINNDRFVKKDLYGNSPVSINFVERVFDFDDIEYFFIIKDRTESSFLLLDEEEEEIGTFKYDEPITTILGKLIVTKNAPKKEGTLDALKKEGAEETVNEILVQIKPVQKVVDYYVKEVKIAPTDKFSTVLELSLLNATPAKAKDYLNTMITLYNDGAIADKRFISEKTSEFIDSRLVLITDELGDVEKNVEGYKARNSITDIPTELKIHLENANVYEKQIIENETELKVISSLIEFLKNSKPNELLPGNIVSTDVSSNSLINQYNQLVLERNKLSTSTTKLNPAIVKLDDQINSMKASVLESLLRAESNLKITRRELASKESELKSKLSLVPKQEREFRIIDRQQKVKEAIYLYLFQKREETAIALAATEQNAKIIDVAKSSDKPVAPKKAIILLAALIMGGLIPFALIYLRNLLDTKVKTRLDIEENTQVPFLGDIPHSNDNSKIVNIASRTSTAEALRIIRTNLEFMLSGVQEGNAKMIFLTSTFPKEGKTFTSVNIAATIALSGKRTLLIGLDIRNPRLDDYIMLPTKGVSDYLLRKEDDINQYVVKIDGYENMYALPAGTIPPNPAELLMGDRIGDMFETLKKQYDYIIVDTAPVSLVTDTLLIAKYADTFIYVARANYLDKRMLKLPNDLHKEGKLPNMSIILNDTETNKGYGYGYGYGYGQDLEVDKRPWWKKLLNLK
ncbi:polysaccharide biosynthesis tyrosine autokinase [Myroides odoratimimus]|uniref:GumC family protein n=1 Tax=Myroides odoratimimus TaxID=76832 RepID=UPI002579041E|nr:tyrosine-protein kinase [Myroides odoratimimus]MDM1397427.1 polysaccharide biosynthesis tyrosine autokinase [Myroides odoratimimus]